MDSKIGSSVYGYKLYYIIIKYINTSYLKYIIILKYACCSYYCIDSVIPKKFKNLTNVLTLQNVKIIIN